MIEIYSSQDQLLNFYAKEVRDKLLFPNHSWYRLMISNGYLFFALGDKHHITKLEKEPEYNEAVGYRYFNVPNPAEFHGYSHILVMEDTQDYFKKNVERLLKIYDNNIDALPRA